jgi:hypothetical protein
MIQISKEELLESIAQGYKDFEASTDKGEKTRLKGWCNAFEALLLHYAPELKDEMLLLRNRIIKPKKHLPDDIDLDTPTILRTGKSKMVLNS